MINDILNEADGKMDKSVEATREEFAAIRAGRAQPSMFNKILVDYYGTPTPLQQLASFTAPEARIVIDLALRHGRDGQRSRRRSATPTSASTRPTTARCCAACSPSSPRSAARSTSSSPGPRPRTAGWPSATCAAHAKQHLEKLAKDGEVGKDDVTGAEKRLDAMTKKHTDAIDEMLEAQGSRAARGLSTSSDFTR